MGCGLKLLQILLSEYMCSHALLQLILTEDHNIGMVLGNRPLVVVVLGHRSIVVLLLGRELQLS